MHWCTSYVGAITYATRITTTHITGYRYILITRSLL